MRYTIFDTIEFRRYTVLSVILTAINRPPSAINKESAHGRTTDSHISINYYYQKDYRARGEWCSRAEVKEIVQPMNRPLTRCFAGSRCDEVFFFRTATCYVVLKKKKLKKKKRFFSGGWRTLSRHNRSYTVWLKNRMNPLARSHHEWISIYTWRSYVFLNDLLPTIRFQVNRTVF
jgi:hypothetical protein